MTWKIGRRVRRASQLLFFVFAVVLLFTALRGRPELPLADVFFRFNPLSALASMVAARSWIPRLGLALVTVGVTLLLGRVWCGWICPMGTLVDWLRIPSAKKREARVSPRWRIAKQVLLVAILAAALVGNLSLLVFDPLAIFTRSMGSVVLPALDRAVSGLEQALYPLAFLRPAIDALETALRGPVLPAARAAFSGSIFIALLLVGILALNALADRFWCRFLCPLGALLGYLSRFALLRPIVGSACRDCGKCKRVCSMGAISTSQGYQVMPSECVLCLDCLADCPKKDIGLRAVLPPLPAAIEGEGGTSLSRRQALGSVAAAVAGVLVAETGVRAKQPYSMLIRPPGAQDEAAFLSHCLRCSQCIRVCPTNGLQPALGEAGVESLWTPRLTPRLGACDYSCTTCGQVCPSGAIPLLDLAAKRKTVIGLAAVDRNRCLPWSYNVPCIVCEEMCPTPTKSIRLEEVKVTGKDGKELLVQRPYVLRELCIGCGICESHCPLKGDAAIRIYRI